MKNSFKYILSAASFLFMAAGVSFAQDLEAHKSVASNDKGGYTLTLEAWATGEQVQRTETVAQPLDIVLVLDVSGSMENNFGTEYINVTETKFAQGTSSLRNINDLTSTDYYYLVTSGKDPYKKIKSQTGTTTRTITLEDGTTARVSRDYKPYVLQTTTNRRRKNRLDALKDACYAFINNIEARAELDDCDHQISIVKYASDTNSEEGNSFFYNNQTNLVYNPYLFNYSQIMTGLNSNYDGLRNTIDDLKYGGVTRSDFGLAHASTVLGSVPSDRDSKKIVVMFTDGEPCSSGNKYQEAIANNAIYNAKTLKDNDVIVYTVGVFSDPSPDVVNYMNYVSSNYPSASDMDNAGTNEDTKYYMTASNPAELENIFTTISNDVSDDAKTTELTSTTSSIRDYVTPQFKLDGDPKDVRIFTVNANGKDSFDEGTKSENLNGKLTNNDPENPGERYAVLFQNGEQEGEKKVVVTGFDFKKHWVGEVENETTGEKGYNKDGQKIVIEIDIVLAGDASGVIETNTSDSGIYAYDSTTGENIQEAEFTMVGIGFPVPQAVNPGPAYLTIVNNFLENVGPQSAVFEIKDEEGNVLYNVMLTDSNNQATVKVDWLNLVEGETVDSENLGDKMKSFTVTEKGWSMNGISRADSPVNTLYKWDAVDKKWVENVFIFNSATESEVEHDETYVLDVK